MYVIALGDVFRPGGHQIAAFLEQVAAAVGGLYAVADDVRQGRVRRLPAPPPSSLRPSLGCF